MQRVVVECELLGWCDGRSSISSGQRQSVYESFDGVMTSATMLDMAYHLHNQPECTFAPRPLCYQLEEILHCRNAYAPVYHGRLLPDFAIVTYILTNSVSVVKKTWW